MRLFYLLIYLIRSLPVKAHFAFVGARAPVVAPWRSVEVQEDAGDHTWTYCQIACTISPSHHARAMLFARRIIDGTYCGFSSITILDKLTYAGTLTNLLEIPPGEFNFIQGDICDQELVDRLAKEHDVIVNFAAESHVDRSISGAREFIATNVLGTQTMLDAVKKSNVETYLRFLPMKFTALSLWDHGWNLIHYFQILRIQLPRLRQT